jgi:hypothetical protein
VTVHLASKAQGAVAHRLEPAHGFHGVGSINGSQDISVSCVSASDSSSFLFVFNMVSEIFYIVLCCVDSLYIIKLSRPL